MALKILMRAGMSPLKKYTTEEILKYDLIGSNSGNLVYAYGAMRALMAEDDTVIDVDGYAAESGRMTDEDIDRINSEYDVYVIPLANAFRNSFRDRLNNLSDFIGKLTIPAVMFSGGITAPIGRDIHDHLGYEEETHRFIKTVLDHSASVALRGEMSADFMKKLGFRPEQDYTVVGCPSVYMYGTDIGALSCALPEEHERVILTNNALADKKVHDLMRRFSARYSNFSFIPQRTSELSMMYLGRQLPEELRPEGYPSDLDDDFYKNDRARFFVSFPEWLDFVSGAALCVGPRLHGSIVCMLAHVPALLIARDVRTKELADYHHFTYIGQNEISPETDVTKLLEKADFSSMFACRQRNFDHYRDFLRKNGLITIFDGGRCPARGEAPLDKKVALTQKIPGIHAQNSVPCTERSVRKARYLALSIHYKYRQYTQKPWL